MVTVAVTFGVAILQSTVWAVFLVFLAVLLAAGAMLALAYGHGSLLLLFVLNVFATDLGLLREAAPTGELNAQVVLKLAMYVVTAGLSIFWIQIERRSASVALVVGYSLVCLLSTVYSVDRMFSFGAACVLASQVVLAIALSMRCREFEHVKVALRGLVVCLSLKTGGSWLVAWLIPNFGFVASPSQGPEAAVFGFERFWGLANPNTTGLNAAVLIALAIPFALTATSRLRSPYTYAVILAAMTIVATQSRTAVAAAGAACIAAVWFVHKRLAVAVLLPAIIAGALYMEVGLTDVARLSSRTGAEDEAISFAGRTQIWAAVADKVSESPFLGFGYGTGRIIVSEVVIWRFGRSFHSAHNAILESMINVGLPGTLLLLWLVLVSAGRAWRFERQSRSNATNHPYAVAIFGLAVVIFVNGLTESGFAGVQAIQSLLLFWLFLTLGWLVRREDRESSTAAH